VCNTAQGASCGGYFRHVASSRNWRPLDLTSASK
jgi:hypothetical protein